MALHSGHMVNLDTTVVSDVVRTKFQLGSRSNRDPANLARATYAALVESRAMLGFSSRQLARVIDKFTTGQPWASVAAWNTNGYQQFAAKRSVGGIYSGSSDHRRLSIAAGLFAARQISCQHLGDAEIDCDVMGISSTGLTSPIVIADNVALPTFDPANDERFTLGPIEVGGIALEGVTDITIDFGITEDWRSTDSKPFPTDASVQSYLPTIRINGLTQAWLGASGFTALGAEAEQADTEIYFRKRAHGGVFVADETEEHIKIAAAGLVRVEGGDTSGNEDAPISLVIDVVHDGTNVELAIDTTAALP